MPASSRPLSRRGVLGGAAAAGAVAALPFSASPADAAATPYLPPIRAYPATRLPNAATRHMANRFAYGYTPGLRKEMIAAGGPRAWFTKQLNPAAIPDPRADVFASWFPTRERTAAEHFDLAGSGSGYMPLVTDNHARWSLLRRTYSTRQVHESMSEFWLNHLHIYIYGDLAWLWRTDYDAVIRQHALGRFDEMLQAAIVHPAMLAYLDGDLSYINRREKASGEVVVTEMINENLGREVLELHTVGRGAAYTEADVKNSAYILTGYQIDRFKTWAFSYEPSRHYTGDVTVLGFSRPNDALDGRAVLMDYLYYLAHHRSTAERIARKLAVRFVSDKPTAGLVTHLADVFQQSGTDIKATLTALVDHPEFAASAGLKVRTPNEDLVATLRAYQVDITKPSGFGDAGNALMYLSKSAGQAPFGWERPDGFPDNGSLWSSGARMMGSYRTHYTWAAQHFPSTGVRYRPHAAWLPQPQIRFDQLVDHLCRVLHGRPSTSRLLGAACITTGMTPATVITDDCVLTNYRMPRLLGLLLDTPQFLTR